MSKGRIITDTRLPRPEERRDATVQVKKIHTDAKVMMAGTAKAYMGFGDRTPRAPNVKIDPLHKAMAMEVLVNYTELCFPKGDGVLCHEGLKEAIARHLKNPNTQDGLRKAKEN